MFSHIVLPTRRISFNIAGFHTFHQFRPITEQDERRMAELEKYYEAGKGHLYLPKCLDLLIKKVTRKNLTTTDGREFISKILCDTATETNKYINYFAIGNDSTAATIADSTLGNEIFRKTIVSAAEDSNTANIAAFIAASEANFDWEEWGHYVDGGAGADSGVLFSHHIDSTISKSSPDTVTIDSIYTLTDA